MGTSNAQRRDAVVRKQRTANPLIVPARYNFLYSPQGRPCGRPPAAAVLGRQKTRLPYRPSGRFWLLSQSIGKANLKELPHRWEAARDCFSGQMPSVGRQTLILRRNGRRLGPLPL
jgi:hypothetical protein